MNAPETGGEGRRPTIGRPSLRLDADAQSAALGRRIALFIVALLVSVAAGAAMARVNPLLVFGVVFCGIFVLAVMRWPFVGLLVYVIVYVLRLGELYPALAPLRIERVIGLLTLVSLILAQLMSRGEIAFDHSRQTRRFLALILAAAASIPLAYWRMKAINGVVEILKISLFYLLVVQLLDTRKKLRTFVFLYGALISYIALTSVADYARGSLMVAQGIDRAVGATSAGGGPNEMGATMASMVPVFLLLGTYKPLRAWRIVFLAGLTLLLVTMAITGSRSALLGFLAGMVYLWWNSKRRVLLGALGVIALVAGFAALPDQYKGRYETIASKKLDGSSSDRLKVWREGFRMVAHRPLTGVGIGCFGNANTTSYRTWHGSRKSYLESHNLYVQVPAEMGLIGAIAFFSFVFEFMRLNRRASQALQSSTQDWGLEWTILKALFTGFIVLLVTSIFGHSLMRHTWYLYAALGLSTARIYLDHATSPSLQARHALIG
jgi:O-antigen ligase